MNFQTLTPDKSIALLVRNILVFEEQAAHQKTVLPFFADGYPGLMFQEAQNGLWVNPHNKKMPPLFLYGQTLKPIELIMEGSYKLIVFQLYPFVLKSFFKLEPGDLNDNCYDLDQLENKLGTLTCHKLQEAQSLETRMKIITDLLGLLFKNKQQELDLPIAQAIQKIINKKGQQVIGDLYEELCLTERTFERRFFKAAGVTAKQFSKIIQFQQSLEQLTVKDYTRLSDIVYANGFADQSHFIKVFKAFTGKTPLAFRTRQ